MNKITKICSVSICFLLVGAVAFGIMTRASYKNFDYDKAVLYQQTISVNSDVINSLSNKKIMKQLNKMDTALIVLVKENEQSYKSIKTFAYVEKVIKGNEKLVDKTVAIYETAFMSYQKEAETLNFRCMNNLSIGMQPGKRYLVFADEVKYAEEYKENLPYDEFIVDWDYYMYSFPLDTEIEPIKYKSSLTYGDIKNYDYICFTDESAEKLEEIRLNVLEKYLDEAA